MKKIISGSLGQIQLSPHKKTQNQEQIITVLENEEYPEPEEYNQEPTDSPTFGRQFMQTGESLQKEKPSLIMQNQLVTNTTKLRQINQNLTQPKAGSSFAQPSKSGYSPLKASALLNLQSNTSKKQQNNKTIALEIPRQPEDLASLTINSLKYQYGYFDETQNFVDQLQRMMVAIPKIQNSPLPHTNISSRGNSPFTQSNVKSRKQSRHLDSQELMAQIESLNKTSEAQERKPIEYLKTVKQVPVFNIGTTDQIVRNQRVQRVPEGNFHKRNELFNIYGSDLKQNHIQMIGSLSQSEQEPSQQLNQQQDPVSVSEQVLPLPLQIKKKQFNPSDLYHFADMNKLQNDLKIPLSRGLGPVNLGTESWTLAKSKVNLAQAFSERIRAENKEKSPDQNVRKLETRNTQISNVAVSVKPPSTRQQKVKNVKSLERVKSVKKVHRRMSHASNYENDDVEFGSQQMNDFRTLELRNAELNDQVRILKHSLYQL